VWRATSEKKSKMAATMGAGKLRWKEPPLKWPPEWWTQRVVLTWHPFADTHSTSRARWVTEVVGMEPVRPPPAWQWFTTVAQLSNT
jgi:hypothetical protein